MSAVAFDTLKFARALRDKAKLSPEQAEGLADALVDVFDGNLATKADIRDVQADIQRVRSEVETLKVQTRADIEALRLTTKADIEAVKGAIAAAKVETVRWLVGAIGFQTLAVLGAVVALTRTIH
ncbi:CCDC90 family protein [Methylobacterium sp. E-065]|uniref:CCDC90 family protein n=1 Tax=Methylobacterium sp. E-065 TaxID=2836583 RepID=UPI001FBB929E|nr:CCDC90 family protein [Methylobacterium sp. E-065]MCJ2019282.1 CCDC90 family protein [Methylobacterium sp. E-065]